MGDHHGHHPDLGRDEERMKAVNAAWDDLCKMIVGLA